MKTTNIFKEYYKNKFYYSVYAKTIELGFDPKYLPNEPDRTNFGNKLDWKNKTKEVESLLSKSGFKVFVKNSKGIPILSKTPTSAGDKTYKIKRILKSKNDVSLYTNIKNYYESNNRFFNFSRRSKQSVLPPTPTYEIIKYFFTDLFLNIKLLSTKNTSIVHDSSIDLNIDIFSRKNKLYSTFSELNLNIYIDNVKECMINGGKPKTKNFGYMLLGGNPNNSNPLTLEEWCDINQP